MFWARRIVIEKDERIESRYSASSDEPLLSPCCPSWRRDEIPLSSGTMWDAHERQQSGRVLVLADHGEDDPRVQLADEHLEPTNACLCRLSERDALEAVVADHTPHSVLSGPAPHISRTMPEPRSQDVEQRLGEKAEDAPSAGRLRHGSPSGRRTIASATDAARKSTSFKRTFWTREP